MLGEDLGRAVREPRLEHAGGGRLGDEGRDRWHRRDPEESAAAEEAIARKTAIAAVVVVQEVPVVAPLPPHVPMVRTGFVLSWECNTRE